MAKIILIDDENGQVREFFSDVKSCLANQGLEPNADFEFRPSERGKALSEKDEVVLFVRRDRVIYRTRRRIIDSDHERVAASILSKFGARRVVATGAW